MGKRFENKVVLITGGAGGIGKEAAKRFLNEGAKIALVDLNTDSLNMIKNELDNLGEILVIPADVTVEADVENYVQQTFSTFGKIDIFLNNAGVEGNVNTKRGWDIRVENTPFNEKKGRKRVLNAFSALRFELKKREEVVLSQLLFYFILLNYPNNFSNSVRLRSNKSNAN